MWIDRFMGAAIRRSARSRPAILVTGARQTGKTSLLKRIFPDHHFVSLDLPSEAALAEQNPEAFLQLHPAPLIIDEVQYAPTIFRHLKLLIDRDRERFGRFLLTGSQKHALMRYTGESLAGRIDVFELETLGRPELLQAGVNLAIPANILAGGYPEIHAQSEIDRQRFYQSYTATYLERDVRSMLSVGSLRDFDRFIRAAAMRTGQLLNKAELARDIGISPTTANAWLSVLEASGIVVLLEPWFSNRLKSVVKSPKLYFADTGLLCSLLDIRNEEELLRAPNIGAIWETFVFAEIRKRQEHEQGTWQCFFISDRSREVDFLIHHGGRFQLLEAKWSEHPHPADASAMAVFAERLGEANVTRRSLVCRTPNAYPLDGNTIAVSIDEIQV